MPLLQQENGRRPGGGTRGNRRSLSKFLELNSSSNADLVATPKPPGGHTSEDWHWDLPDSPEAAQTPGSLVPSNCFPPRHPRAFASYSERARPGSFVESGQGQGITDLVAGLSLTTPSSSSDYLPSSSCDKLLVTKRVSKHCSQNFGHTTSENRKKEFISRRATFCGAENSESQLLVWSGSLPSRTLNGDSFSTKVFLGGLPWDVSEFGVMQALKKFKPLCVEWPGRGSGLPGSGGDDGPRGFAYVTLENEQNVHAFLSAARRNGNKWYYRISARNMKTKEVEVIPWSVSDSVYVVGSSIRLDPNRTVFVGALHGMLSAEGLATIMNDLFAGVVYAGIDTDKHKYPIGSGRVTFNNLGSYICAVSAGFIEIRTDKFIKKVQVDPYIEDSMCSVCNMQQGPYFCRNPECFSYYCRNCWPTRHPTSSPAHRALMRNFKSNQGQPVVVPNNIVFSQNGNMVLANRRMSLCDQSAAFSAADSTPSPPTSGFGALSDHAPDENQDW